MSSTGDTISGSETDLLDKNYYAVLHQTDIQKLLQQDINHISSLLHLSNDESCLLILHFNWNLDQLEKQWFANEDKVRIQVCIFDNKPTCAICIGSSDDLTCIRCGHFPRNLDEVKEKVRIFDKKPIEVEGVINTTCGICFERSDGLTCAGCGHLYCQECWLCYLRTAINDGPGCLTLRCPDPYCYAAVGLGMVDRVGSEEDNERYNCYLRRSYTEKGPLVRMCPASDCEYAVAYIVGSTAGSYLHRTLVKSQPTVMWCPAPCYEFAVECVDGITARSYDVVCRCLNAFCWECREDAHSPVDCDTVSAWVLKNSLDGKYMKWILENTKPCPKCKQPVDNKMIDVDALMIMVGDVLDSAKINKWMQVKFSEKYYRYYKRWIINNESRQEALRELKYMQNEGLETISKLHNQPKEQIEFCVEAWQQISECRRILKWSCAYGHSLPAHESSKHKRFEGIQDQVHDALGKLQHYAQIELKKYIKPHGKAPKFEDKDFNTFRTRLVRLTMDTRKSLKNLVQAFENGLCNVGPENLNSKEDTSMIDKSSDNGLCAECILIATREDELLPECIKGDIMMDD